MKEITENDVNYMKRALSLALKGTGKVNPNPLVGAVIVKGGKVIGEGAHEYFGGPHAEVNAFKNALEDPMGADLYVTLEPCSHHGKTPPCADLIIEKKIKRVFIGTLDPNPLVSGSGVKKLEDAGIEVFHGILTDECMSLNEVFMKYIVDKDPFILVKYAMSLDGKIATHTGDSKWITGENARFHSHSLRNKYMGIMVGIGTVFSDDPELTCRQEGGRDPIRIVADTHLRIPLDAKILDTSKAKTIIATGTLEDEKKAQKIRDMGAQILVCPDDNDKEKIDLYSLFRTLGQMGIDGIMIEGGGELLFSVMEGGFADRVIAYMAPVLIGGRDAKTPLEGRGFSRIKDCIRLKDTVSISFNDGDFAVTGRVVR